MKRFSEWLLLRETLMGTCRNCGATNVELWPGNFCEKCRKPYVPPKPNAQPLDSMVNRTNIDQNRYRSPGQKAKLGKNQ